MADLGGGGDGGSSAITTFWCHGCSDFCQTVESEADELVCGRCHGGFVEYVGFLFDMDTRLFLLASTNGGGGGGEGENLLHMLESPLPLVEEEEESSGAVAGACPASWRSVEAMPQMTVTPGRPLSGECAICRDEYVPPQVATGMPCGHVFHRACIRSWLAMHNTCPLCRFHMPSAMDEFLLPSHQSHHHRRGRRGGRFSLAKVWPVRALARLFRRQSRRRSEEEEEYSVYEVRRQSPAFSRSFAATASSLWFPRRRAYS